MSGDTTVLVDADQIVVVSESVPVPGALDAAIALQQVTAQATLATDAATATAEDRLATGEDRAQTALDAQATGEDRLATGQDREQTGQDRQATGDDRAQTGRDRAATAESAAAAAHILGGTFDPAALPATRADGAALQAGDICFGTDGHTYARIGGAWVNQTAAAALSAASALASQNAAGTSEGNAAASATSALSAKGAAELARDASFALGPKYATEALGRAAVADGATYLVQGSGDVAAYEYRRTASVNLFNAATVRDGHYVNSGTGQISVAAGWGCSAFIPVTAGLQYTLSGTRAQSGHCFFTSASDAAQIGASNSTAAFPVTVTAPVGANFLVINLYNSTTPTYSNVQVEQAAAATAYQPYGSYGALIASYPSAASVTAVATRATALEAATADLSKSIGPGYVYAVEDATGNAALAIDDGGTVHAPVLAGGTATFTGQTTAQSYGLTSGEATTSQNTPEFVWAIGDSAGNVALGVRPNGTVYPSVPVISGYSTLSIGDDDSIVHIGDSYTGAHYVLKDKAYISQLSQLSPYRHQGYGVSGNDALDMQYRIINGDGSTGQAFTQMKARYAFITSLTNDSPFRAADLTYYEENMRRLVETVRATGTEPVITTEFPATSIENALLRRVADEYGCGFIDCTSYDAEVGALQLGPFFQGHPGTRTGGVFWLPMLAYIDRMPKPNRAIKIFRRRATYAVGTIADLLYKDRLDRANKWKELTLSHYAFTTPERFEELSQLGTIGVDYNYALQADEYQALAAGSAVAFTDYALMEITLPGTAMSLSAVEITLTTAGAPTVYARDFLNVSAEEPGKAQGSSPTDPTYLSKWNTPRGAWRSLGVYSGAITIPQAQLRNSMSGDKLVLMVAGAFSLTGLQVRYSGREVKSDLRPLDRLAPISAELLAQPLCGTAPQLAAWTQSGTPAALVPIDLSNAPRKPGLTTPVDGVCTITASNMIGQTVTLPAETGRPRRYMLTVWARYFPKAYLDPTKYPGLDAAQVIDRIANPGTAPITTDSCDLRTLKAEVWPGGAYPAAGGAEFFGFAALQWRPVEFLVEVPPYRTPATLSFRLSCTDGEIQVSKASWKEVAP